MTLFLIYLLGCFFLGLPFLPSIFEILRPSDSKSLKITNHILRDPRSSPQFLFWHYAQLLGAENLEALSAIAHVDKPTLLNESILALPKGKVSTLDRSISRVLSGGSIELLSHTAYLCKIVSLQSILTGSHNGLNEIHAKDRLTIGENSKLLWWASGTDIILKPRLDLPGKIQANRSIQIEGEMLFHHLEAPTISYATEERLAHFVALPLTLPRHTYKESCNIKANETFEGDLIVKGDLVLNENSAVHGSVKCHGKLILHSGSRVTGNVVSLGDMECLGNNWIGGTILGQKNISFLPGARIGSENQKVTLSAHTIQISKNFKAHGTIRAWKRGIVRGP